MYYFVLGGIFKRPEASKNERSAESVDNHDCCALFPSRGIFERSEASQNERSTESDENHDSRALCLLAG